MEEILREYFGFGGYKRAPEGGYSWQHLLFVTSLMAVMVLLAVVIGRRNRPRDEKTKNRVLVIAAILIDSLELFKIVLLCFRSGDPLNFLSDLPLFLCSIQLITIPLAAFSQGRVREAALDFVCIFGILGALAGTYGAAQIYNANPVMSFDNNVSGVTHAISGFCSLYILIAGMASMKKRNMGITFAIMLFFCGAAYIVDIINTKTGYQNNYMFLLRGDGTPYDIAYNIVKGSPVLYPLFVVALFLAYIVLYYWLFYVIKNKKAADK